MAALTLTDKSTMATKQSFQMRMVAAVKFKAKGWAGTPLTTFASYNVAMQKRKAFSRQILTSGSIPSPQAYAEFFLNEYTNGSPDLDENGELSDTVLLSSSQATTFDFFAGVEDGDLTKQIIL